ncbi:MAG: VWA domain-containing protein [Acidobacteria bacterium]|nr:VWA domain-containing protein [Acidobacteriota bacterium]
MWNRHREFDPVRRPQAEACGCTLKRAPRGRAVTRLILSLAVLALALGAQEETGAVFRADTRLVVLHATVLDKNGKFVTDLPRSAFRVYENGAEQQLKIFRREDVPVSMGIVIDNSGSMREKRKKVEDAAMSLVKASNPQDEIFIVNFADEAFLDVPFTSDVKKMEEGVARIDSRGGTAMRDAIFLSMEELREKAKKDKKVIVVVTDGNDNLSEITLERLVQKLQEREVLIYTIGLLNEEERGEAKRAKRALNAIAAATGGQAYYPGKVEDVGRFTLDVARDIRNQYILAYSPAMQELDGSFRQIRVTANGPNRPTVRTRTGYYAVAEDGTAALPKPGAPRR